MQTNELEVQMSNIESSVNKLRVTNNAELSTAGDLLFRIKDFIKNWKAEKVKKLAPFKVGIKGVEQMFDPALEAAEHHKKIVDSIMISYQLKVKAEAEAEEQKRRLASMARMEETKDALIDIAAQNPGSDCLVAEALKIEENQERLMKEPIKIGTTSKGEYSTTTLKMVWDYELVEPEKVERKYCEPSPAKIRRAVNEGLREIAGVRIFQKATNSSRM